ncbi:hypothetical protein U9M48_006548 [Paspalum notatum var. saurae]|uniref:Cystatin domain-containing protein n=1 Tax=Paspalum notatum var. saurae TaxID=547442 RepID=A0AAQ3SJK1_PASNO
MKTGALLFALAAVASAVTAPVVVAEGESHPISGVDDPHVQELGAWAVTEHGKRANDELRFGKVVGGDEWVAAGMDYYQLYIVAVNLASQNVTYNAVVSEQIRTNTRKLISFDRAN